MTEQTATVATEFDKGRRYLRPVAEYGTDEVHLSVYQWLPNFEEWATGMSLCGGSMEQGALPEGTVVTCRGCLEYQPKYERYLTPGYNPADEDPELLRAKLERIRADIGRMCNCCATNREYLGRIRRELGLSTDGYPGPDGEGA